MYIPAMANLVCAVACYIAARRVNAAAGEADFHRSVRFTMAVLFALSALFFAVLPHLRVE